MSGGLKNTHAAIAWREANETTVNIVASSMCAAGLINDCRQVAAADKGEACTNNAYSEHTFLVVDDFFNLQVTQEPEIDYKVADIVPSSHGTRSPVTNLWYYTTPTVKRPRGMASTRFDPAQSVVARLRLYDVTHESV